MCIRDRNTYDIKTDEIDLSVPNTDEVGIQGSTQLNSLIEELANATEEECESCAI